MNCFKTFLDYSKTKTKVKKKRRSQTPLLSQFKSYLYFSVHLFFNFFEFVFHRFQPFLARFNQS